MSFHMAVRSTAIVLALSGGAVFLTSGCRGGAQSDATAGVQYFCPMHPQIVRDRPGDCPICGMKLEKREPATDASGSPHGHTAANTSGRITVTIPAARRDLLGVRTDEVRVQDLARDVTTVGRVAVDERRIHHQHSKFEGYVEHLHVDFTGRLVQRGDPLLALYSPELVATQQEYLAVYRAQEKLANSPIESVARGATDLLEAARQRLLLWDIRRADIERLERTGEVRRSLDLHAERGGYVVEKSAVHGMRITPADVLFKIADLSHLWVLADLYESDLATARIGQRAEVRAVHAPGRLWQGPVTWIAPTVDEQTRTIKARVEIDNPGDVLKPDMYADVVLRGESRRALVVPESAVLETGAQRLVFVDLGDGRYEPRPVTLGGKAGPVYEVLSGVAAGEHVVTAASFLIDSESSLKAAVARVAR